MDTPPTASQAPAGRWHDALGWAAVGVLLLLQYGLFRQCVLLEVAWAYPGNYDQTVYLTQSYDTYERMRAGGAYDGLKHGYYLRTPTGALLHLQAAVLFFLLGPSRLSALTLNFLYFALLQLALAGTLRWLTRRWSAALLGVGLLLTALAPFVEAGGVLDFRLDFFAFCLFGVFVCAVLRSDVLRSRRWALAVGASAAWLVLTRSLTLVYLAGMAGPLALYLLYRFWRPASAEGKRVAARRLAGLGLAGAVVAVAVLPVLWDRREQLWGYYVVGHVTGVEKFIRAGNGDLTWYYPASLLRDHAGPAFLKLAGLALLVAAGAAVVRRARGGAAAGPARLGLAPAFVYLALAVAVPLAALTIDLHRSPCAGSVLLPGLLGLVLAGVVGLAGLHREGPPRPGLTAPLTVLAAVAVAAGAWAQFGGYAAPRRPTACRHEVEQIHALFERMHRCCADYCWSAPVLSATVNRDYTQHEAFAAWAYERHGTLRQTGVALGAAIVPLTEEEIRNGAWASDFLVLVTTAAAPPYPSERCLREALPKLRAYCETELVRQGTFDIEGAEVTLYARPALRVEGLINGWVPDVGLRLSGPAARLRGRSRVILSGRTGLAAQLPEFPAVRAELAAGGGSRTVPAAFEVSADRQSYRLVIQVAGQELPDEGPVEIRLSFAGCLPYFLPPGLYVNTRRLVVPAPERTELLRD
jgi:hypothetical protein